MAHALLSLKLTFKSRQIETEMISPAKILKMKFANLVKLLKLTP